MERWLAQYKMAKEHLPGAGNAALEQLRGQEMDKVRSLGVPQRSNEAWKYTRLDKLAEKDFVFASSAAQVDIPETDLEHLRFSGLETMELLFINGQLRSADRSEIEGLRVVPLAEWLDNGGDLPPLPDEANVFASLNNALVTDGVLIEVDKNVRVDKTIHLIFVNAETNQSVMQHPRVIIKSAVNSEVRVIESYYGLGSANHLTNVLTHIQAGANSQVEHYRIQEEALGTCHIANLVIEQDADSRVTNHAIALGGAIARVDTHALLQARNAVVQLNGLYMVDGDQHSDQRIQIDHAHERTYSDQFYKGVMSDKGTGAFNGKIIVHEDAQKIEALQSNKNLLLSDHATINTKPELVIFADDVRCTHGATIGQLDENAMFYLMSRGLEEEKARSVLTYAFADEVTERMSLDPVRRYVEKRVVGQVADERIADLEASI